MADLKDVINYIEKREESEKSSKPLEEWISTKEGKTVVDSLPMQERSFLKDIFNRYQGSTLSKVLGAVKKLSTDEIKLGVSKEFNNGGLLDSKVGKKINKTTQAGRDVYVTSDGKNVSEKSTTFKYKGNWINVPSIFNGYKYDDKTIRLMLDKGIVKPTSTHNNTLLHGAGAVTRVHRERDLCRNRR